MSEDWGSNQGESKPRLELKEFRRNIHTISGECGVVTLDVPIANAGAIPGRFSRCSVSSDLALVIPETKYAHLKSGHTQSEHLRPIIAGHVGDPKPPKPKKFPKEFSAPP